MCQVNYCPNLRDRLRREAVITHDERWWKFAALAPPVTPEKP